MLALAFIRRDQVVLRLPFCAVSFDQLAITGECFSQVVAQAFALLLEFLATLAPVCRHSHFLHAQPTLMRSRRRRAEDKLGELSAALDASKGGKNPKATLPAAGKSKAQALKAAGISTSAAQISRAGLADLL
jgi:hypothetical protein